MTKSLLNFHCEVAKSDEGMSLRKYLQQRFGLSSTRLKSLRRRGISRINGLHKPLITILHSGDIIDVTCPEISAPELDLDALERASCPVVYQDEHYLLVNKPPGLLVHPSYQETLAITTLLSSEPLHPVRRLDLDTSGLVLIALNPYAHERLIFSELEKRYRVLVYGRLPERALSLSLPQSRNPKLTLQRIVSRTGQVAISTFREWQYWPEHEISLLDVEAQTGRTHQIRSQLLYLGLPLLGDWLYGVEALEAYLDSGAFYSLEARLRAQDLMRRHQLKTLSSHGFTRQALDADQLRFRDVKTGLVLDFQATWPADFQAFIDKNGLDLAPRPSL